MKKIMFNDRYGLTEAVIAGRKTVTRRVVKLPDGLKPLDVWNPVMGIDDKGKVYFTFDCIDAKQRDIYPKYQPGEVVAVAQSYKTIYDTMEEAVGNSKANEWWCKLHNHIGFLGPAVTPGYRNKMFVNADFMPYRICIDNIRIERLQDITDDDCLHEGVQKGPIDGWYVQGIGMTYPKYAMKPIGKYANGNPYYGDRYRNFKYDTPREAFAALIDRTCGSGTWESNPWVAAYDFCLQKAPGFK